MTLKIVPQPTDEEMLAEIQKYSTTELNMRLKLGDFICRSIADDPDPRRPLAIRRLRHQQKLINQVIQERAMQKRINAGLDSPSAVTLTMKTLDMRATAARRQT